MMSDLLEDVMGTHSCYQEPLLTAFFGKTLPAETDYVNPEQIIREKRENLHGAYDP